MRSHYRNSPQVSGATGVAPASQSASSGPLIASSSAGAGAGLPAGLTWDNAYLKAVRTDNGATGPTLRLGLDSASPAADDICGMLEFAGKDSGGNDTVYNRIIGTTVDPTNSSEDGRILIQTVIANDLSTRIIVGAGLYNGAATGGDRGQGTINVSGGYYVNNVPVLTWDGSTLNLTKTDDGATGQILKLGLNSATPAADDICGSLEFVGKDSAGNDTIYNRILGLVLDPTNGSEDGRIFFQTTIANDLSTRIIIGAGLYNGSATGGDKGQGTINVSGGYYVNNVPVPTSSGATGGSGSGGAGNQYVALTINGVTYKVLHDGTI